MNVCVSSTTTERGPTPINLGWIFFILFNILVIIAVFFLETLLYSFLIGSNENQIPNITNNAIFHSSIEKCLDMFPMIRFR